MTTVAEELRAALATDSAVAGMVGQRIRFDMAAETDAFPFIVLRQVANRPERGINGSLHARRESFQVEAWGETRSQSVALHALIEQALVTADMWPEEADPDALDPEIGARACVWTVHIWTG
jgi:hypothetical protein